jgi:hypothetical protein
MACFLFIGGQHSHDVRRCAPGVEHSEPADADNCSIRGLDGASTNSALHLILPGPPQHEPVSATSLPPVVTARFTHSFRDIVRANAALSAAAPLTKWMHRILWSIAALAVLAIALDMVSLGQGVRWMVWPLLILLWIRVFSFWTAWTATRKESVWSGERLYEFSPAGIRISTSTTDSVIAWNAVMRTAETRTDFLYFTSELEAGFIPKRALLPGDQDTLRRLFSTHSGVESGENLTHAAALPSPEVTVQFELDRSEVARVTIATMITSRFILVWFAFAIVLFSWRLFPTYRQWQAGGWQGVSVASVVTSAVALLFLLLLPWLIAHWLARRQIRTGPSARGLQSLGLADWGIRVSGPMYEGDYRWSTFGKAVETPEFFLFFASNSGAMFLPKRLLDREEREAVRALGRAALGSKAEF